MCLCRQRVCCGIIYKGRFGEVLIDPHLYKPCCQKKQEQVREEEDEEQEEEDTELEKEEGQASQSMLASSIAPPDSPPLPLKPEGDEEDEWWLRFPVNWLGILQEFEALCSLQALVKKFSPFPTVHEELELFLWGGMNNLIVCFCVRIVQHLTCFCHFSPVTITVWITFFPPLLSYKGMCVYVVSCIFVGLCSCSVCWISVLHDEIEGNWAVEESCFYYQDLLAQLSVV